MQASVIIISYNSAATITECLRSVLGQRTRYPYEMILVDSSRDNTAGLVKEKFPQVRVLECERRLLPGAARNKGLAAARGAVVIFLAADCLAEPGWLEQRINDHLAGYSLVAGALVSPGTNNLFLWANYFMEYSAQFPGRPRGLLSRVVYTVSYQRDIFEKYGYFPAEREYGEDTVFNRRLIAAGEKIYYDPQIKIHHLGENSWQGFIRHAWRHGRATGNQLLLPARIFFGRQLTILVNCLRWASVTEKLRLFCAWPLVVCGLAAVTAGYLKNENN